MRKHLGVRGGDGRGASAIFTAERFSTAVSGWKYFVKSKDIMFPTSQAARWQRCGIFLLLVVSIIILGRQVLITGKVSLYSNVQPQEKKNTQWNEHQKQLLDSEDNCKALMLHEGGHWDHRYAPLDNETMKTVFNSSSIQETYFPREIEWMAGKNWPSKWGTCVSLNKDAPWMYRSQLGNQCGSCGVAGFQPSHSTWVPASDANTTNSTPTPKNNDAILSPSLRLIRRLAETNNTLCFAGDSLDFQIYSALRHNLIRQKSLQNVMNISVSDTRLIPVNFTTVGLPAYHVYWMVMKEIKETTVSLEYHDSNGDRITSTAIFRFFKTYGWPPWNTLFMEDCNVLTLNLGLHYDPHGRMSGNNYGPPKPRFVSDFRAAITYLVDFVTSRSNRIAIWRSTLPQHFNTPDGHFEKSTSCSRNHFSPHEPIQNYNKAANEEFSKFCKPKSQSCRPGLEQICTMNQTSMDYRSVYKLLVDDNCTSSDCTERLERFRQGNSTTTGRILQWNIDHIFDVPQWHFTNSDCSHFCYVPILYEAAFERLGLLLSSLG